MKIVGCGLYLGSKHESYDVKLPYIELRCYIYISGFTDTIRITFARINCTIPQLIKSIRIKPLSLYLQIADP